MARFNIYEMKDGDRVDEKFVVVEKRTVQRYKGKEGKWFEILIFRKGTYVPLRYWGSESEDVMFLLNSFDVGDYIHVVGKVGEHNSTKYIYVSKKDGGELKKIAGAPEDVLLLIEDIEWIDKTPEDLKAELFSLIESVENHRLRDLLYSFFRDDEFWNRFYRAPAAVSHHSNYIHGLIHHTLNVTHIALNASRIYPVDRDLIIAGSLLHDIGKIDEYEYTDSFEETPDGVLMGHIYIGARMVDEKCRSIPDFPEELRKKLVHIILSHHNRVSMGWGSARDPAIPEAIIIAYADNMDAQVMLHLQIKFSLNPQKNIHHDRTAGWIYKD